MAPHGSEHPERMSAMERVGDGSSHSTLYGIPWLDECYRKVRFPNPKCEEFLTEFNDRLSGKIRGELDNEVKQQALFQLLGRDYVRIHFPHHRYSPDLLEPPRTKPAAKEAYLKEMQSLLEEQMAAAQRDMGIPEDVSKHDTNDELGEFLHEVRSVFKRELDRQVKRQARADRTKDIEQDVMSAKDFDVDEDLGGQRNRRASKKGRSRRRSRADPLDDFMDAIAEEAENANIKANNDFHRSDVPAEAFAAVAKNNGAARESAMQRFKAATLMFPAAIRRFLWIDFVYRHNKEDSNELGGFHRDGRRRRSRREKQREAKVINEHHIEAARARFRHEVNKKIDLKKIHRAVQSTDYKKIHSVIIDSYHTTKILQPLADDATMLQAAHVINVLNVVNKTYSNAQIFVLAPLQMMFPQNNETESDEMAICRLANDLNLLWMKHHLAWEEMFDVAQRVSNDLQVSDPTYYDHLVETLRDDIAPVDVYDFAYEILDRDTDRSVRVWNELYRKKKREWRDKDLQIFGNLDIYLRKWISEAFAGILGRNLVLFVWDLLVLHRWTKEVFYNITMALIFLIRPWAMTATNNRKLSKVLLEEPGRIYIGDLRKAMMMIAEEKPFETITTTNYLEEKRDQKPPPPEVVEPPVVVPAGGELPFFGPENDHDLNPLPPDGEPLTLPEDNAEEASPEDATGDKQKPKTYKLSSLIAQKKAEREQEGGLDGDDKPAESPKKTSKKKKKKKDGDDKDEKKRKKKRESDGDESKSPKKEPKKKKDPGEKEPKDPEKKKAKKEKDPDKEEKGKDPEKKSKDPAKKDKEATKKDKDPAKKEKDAAKKKDAGKKDPAKKEGKKSDSKKDAKKAEAK